MPGLFGELKRRNVFRVAIAYVVVGWVLIQVTSEAVPALALPEWVSTLVFFLLLIGFPVAVLLAWAFELTAQGLLRTEEVDRDASITASTGRRLDFFVIALLTLTLGYFVWDKFGATSESDGDAAARTSIAVLPFVNMSSDPEQEYFSDGISEELLNLLSKMPNLRVASRTSAFAFKGKDADIPTIAGKLGVAHILEGSVRKAGKRLRITAQLIRVEDDSHLWSDVYERELDDVFAIQSEISRAIADALRVHLGDEGAAPKAAGSASIDAYNLYLLGRHRFEQRTKTKLEEARGFFEEAISLDPAYAPAYVGLADSLFLLEDDLDAYGDIPRDEVLRLAGPLAEKALALDPALAEAHATTGMFLQNKGDLTGALAALDRAIALNPNFGRAWHWKEYFLRLAGRYGEAYAAVERALELDPLSPVIASNMVINLTFRGETAKAHAVAHRIISLNPDNHFGYRAAASVEWRRGNLADAARFFGEALARAPQDGLSRRGMTFALFGMGSFDEAREFASDSLTVQSLLNEERFEDALALARRIEAERPGAVAYSIRAFAEAQNGNPGEAAAILEPVISPLLAQGRLIENFGFFNWRGALLLVRIRHKNGDEKGAEALLSEMRDIFAGWRRQGMGDPYREAREALVRAYSGDVESALSLLENAFDKGWREREISYSLLYEPLRGEPRFAALVERMMAELERQHSLYVAARAARTE